MIPTALDKKFCECMKSRLTFEDGTPINCWHARKAICRKRVGLGPCPSGMSGLGGLNNRPGYLSGRSFGAAFFTPLP